MIQTQEVDRFAGRCLRHLQTELAMMHEVIQSLDAIRECLLEARGERLASAVENQQQLRHRVDEMRQVRADLRRQLARVLDVPECDATIGKLAENVSPDMRHPLLDARRHLSQLARDAEVLLRGNTALIRHNAEILQQLAECITGQSALPERYAASGKKEQQVHQSIIQARY